ncbi:DUF2624 domain-containing protein [Bacillus sp. FJAT-50079]|uniref:DUF2624 domain-containing protein n=1 Tax=Bacillus sp. FJAT-50079 TaxID=2833577 RepID=UPI001BCA1CE1|nr:DUF2624 domain-containing protein [Bacillus sp. FJAT-50079]MBS4209094.1 DUF2624 domain-containing protein [Bacillus sp. FJAT-50079]
MQLIKNMVNLKVNSITAEDLLKYSGQFNIKVTRPQAEKIAAYLRGKNFDIFDDRTRSQIVREVAKIAGPETAKEINKLFLQFTS